jgi:hypothetical protein
VAVVVWWWWGAARGDRRPPFFCPSDSILAPAIPLAFALFRPWQLARGAGMAAAAAAAPGSARALAPAALARALRWLASSWTFDTAALLVWLPWTYNWQLQR